MTLMEERIAIVAAEAVREFGGNPVEILKWLERPEEALDGKAPISLLTTDYGFLRVRELLAQWGRPTLRRHVEHVEVIAAAA